MQKTLQVVNLINWLFIVVSIQYVNAQIVIGAPNLEFSQACANNQFNEFGVTFVFSPDTALENSNQFIIELSDSDGDFSNPQQIYISDIGEILSSPALIQFSLPQETAGEAYRVRIKSTAPVATSARSNSFAAYFKIQDTPFSINNLIPTGAYCSGGSYLLTIDNPGTGNNDSPLAYPFLTFNWYRETSPTTAVWVSESPSLEVSTEGTYFVETNYGSCTSNSFSNRVTITEISSGEAEATITSSLGNPYCPEQSLTVLSTISGISYQWFKDGMPIEGANEQTYQTNNSGVFAVQVDLGDCTASGSIDLQSELFVASLNVEEFNEIENGDFLNIIATDNAVNPIYEWYFNDQLIANANSNSYLAEEFGTYKLIISETMGCLGTRTFNIEVSELFNPFPDVEKIPNVISPNGDGINDTWVIPINYVSGTNTAIEIYSSQGKRIFSTNDYQNNWPSNSFNYNDFNQLFYYVITPEDGSTKKGTITLLK